MAYIPELERYQAGGYGGTPSSGGTTVQSKVYTTGTTRTTTPAKTVSGTQKTTKKTAGKSLLGNVIAKLLADIAVNKGGAYSSQQQTAAKEAFIRSGIQTLSVTPRAAWSKLDLPGISPYYRSEIENMVASGRTDPIQGTKSILGLQAEWARRAERSPYMVYPSSTSVKGEKTLIAPYLEAGGLVSSPSYIASNPEYADYMYQKDPEFADRVLANLYIPGVGYTYGGIDEKVKSDFELARKNLEQAKARYMGAKPPWMQAMEAVAPIGTLPPWVQPVAEMTEPRW